MVFAERHVVSHDYKCVEGGQMPIVEGTQTEEQIAAGNAAGAETRKRLASKIMDNKVFQSLEIPGAEEETQQEDPVEEETQESEEEETNEENTEESEEEETQAQEEDGTEETMVPQSKVQRRIDELKSENKRLRALNESRAINKASEESATLDEQTKQLRAMTATEIDALKDQVEDAKFEAYAAKDKNKLAELRTLAKKIDETIRTAPVRFVQAQAAAYNRKADELAAGATIKEIEVAAPKIVAMAREIYQRYPKLQSDVEGQAIALEIAADKYKELSKYSLTKGSVNNLKSQVNNLKKKTSLATNQSKSTGDSNVIENLRKQASNGTTRDKVALVKNDPRFNVDAMIPAEYK